MNALEKHKPEEIVTKLRQVFVLMSQGKRDVLGGRSCFNFSSALLSPPKMGHYKLATLGVTLQRLAESDSPLWAYHPCRTQIRYKRNEFRKRALLVDAAPTANCPLSGTLACQGNSLPDR